MSYPFFIWTMQRTGGTALTELLTQISEHPSAEHEPFNWRGNHPRQFGAVTRGWNETHDNAAALAAMAEIFAQRPLIKHCYELHPMPFNRLLMQATAQTDYRHIVLLRRDELARLVSRFVAQATGTWFRDYAGKVFEELASGRRQLNPIPVDKVVEHYRHCRQATNAVRQRLPEFGIEPYVVHYEDLYVGESGPRLENLAALLRHLEFPPQAMTEYGAAIDDRIFNAGQDIATIGRFLPNFERVTAALAEAGYGTEGEAHKPAANRGRTAELVARGRHREVVGGDWDEIGQLQFDWLRRAGLAPPHRVLDIGCNCLCAGVKLIPYLEPDHYYGIDAHQKLLQVGYKTELSAVLRDRLDRDNLQMSHSFEHPRLAAGTIDFGLAMAVATQFPLNYLRVCLENTAKYFRSSGKLYLAFFELAADARFAPPAINDRGVTTSAVAAPYHYYRRDMIAAADGAGWRARYIGDWGHPLGQSLIEYARI